MYKLLAKILSDKMKTVTPSVIGTSQGAFVQNMQFLDEILIANEPIDSRKRSMEDGVIFKIDMENTFDHVE